MNAKTPIWRALALGSAALLVAVAMSPVVAAQSQLNVRSVGEIFVDAQGRASGQNIVTTIAEANGVLSGFMSLALGTEIFSSVAIEGFAQAEKIQGVGSSNLVLRGSNAVVALYDNINTAMKVQTTSATTIHYQLASGVVARASAAGSGAVDLYEGGSSRCMSTGPECGYLGSIVLVGGNDARGEALAVVNNEVQARMQAGSQAVFIAKPIYLQAEEYHHAIVEAAAEGSLAAHYVTEFEGSAVAASQVDYASHVSARTQATAQSTIETQVRSRAEASALLAYDLAYESLPARSPGDVAVFVDGQLAARAESAAQMQSYAEQGVAAYFATVQNGRSEILASTPDFRSTSEHKLVITANARASSEAQARAENRAEADSRAYGSFEYHGNGKLTGDFLTSIIAEGQMALHSYTSLSSRTEVFKSVSVDGAAEGTFRQLNDHSFQVNGPTADLTLVDDVYATLLVDARAHAEATFELATDVKAHQRTDDIVWLEGPNGYAGAIVLAQADATADAASSLRLDAQGQVRAVMDAGASLVYRGAAEAYASEEVVAEAIAAGELGAQILVGVQASAAAAIATEYYAGVVADVTAQARGSFEVTYESSVESAKSFAFDTRGTALAAKAASDVRVLVDGQAAVLVATPEAALAASGYAKYFAETSIDGSLRVLVNTAAEAGATAVVTIESKLDAAARASAKTDAFGQFKLFGDGTAVGSFVTMKADQQAGAVSDFALISTGEQVFSSIVAGSSAFFSGGADGATTLVLENAQTKLEFSDTTSAFTKIVAKADTEVAFRLAAEVNAEARAATVVELVSSTGAHVGSLIITNANGRAAAASHFETSARGEVAAHLEQGAQILFRAHTGIETELSAAQRTMINQAIASGQIAGQVLVQTQAALSASAHAAAEAQARLEATARASASASATAQADVSAVAIGAAEAAGSVTAAVTATYYNDVQMLTAATQNRVDVTISSTADVGKTIIVSLDPATVAGMASGNAEILFDGHVATQASSYADVLDANNDAGVAEYFVLAGEAGTQVLVSIPHFSVHTVTLKERDASSTPLYMIASIVLGAIVLAETAYIVSRRRA